MHLLYYLDDPRYFIKISGDRTCNIPGTTPPALVCYTGKAEYCLRFIPEGGTSANDHSGQFYEPQ